MDTVKEYFRDQFQMNKITLQHDDASKFYLGSFQRNRLPLPLFCVRLLLFATSVGILTMSLLSPTRQYWLIYLTNWGVIIILVTTGLAVAVSARAYFKGPIVSSFGSPWYVKLYWAAYNVGLTVAFLITIFYYLFLYGMARGLLDPTIDLLTHGINTLVMFLLLITSMHPSNILHCVYPIAVLLVYATFNIIYYFAGGVNHLGDPYIYPMLNWANPGLAIGVLFGCLGAATILHMLIVLISLLRDFLSKKYMRNYNTLDVSN